MSNNKNYDIIIIGAGLTGLALAYYLRNSGKRLLIIEGRDRIGGRILTLKNDGEAPQEMGATWLGRQHRALISLLKELDIETFEQVLGDRAIYEPISTSPPQIVQLPPNNDPSYRIANGTMSIIEKLQSYISDDAIQLDEKVISITEVNDQLNILSDKASYTADIVISTLPPYLLSQTIEITPTLPIELMDAMQHTHTWMGESIKVSLSYSKAFWHSKKTSGTIFSSVGPITEIYDHSDISNNTAALMGFFNGSYFSVSREERLELIMKQLQKYYGDVVHSYISYNEKVWRNDHMTYIPYQDHLLPHQNNGHHLYRASYLNNRLYIAGAETSITHPGYMDGAVSSAIDIAQRINNSYI
jgi:monoamine oxidase